MKLRFVYQWRGFFFLYRLLDVVKLMLISSAKLCSAYTQTSVTFFIMIGLSAQTLTVRFGGIADYILTFKTAK